MNPLYNIGIGAYRLAVKAASLRNPKARKMLEGQASTFSYLKERLDRNCRYIWIHASSLGEFEQGRPLIEKIKACHPEKRILLTFFSPSGYEVRKHYDKVDAVCYMPFDLPCNVKRFLDLVNPEMAIFVKYEFWGNYLMELKRRGVPTYIISAIFRPSQRFFHPWGRMFRQMLHCYTHIYVQNEEARRLPSQIGVDNVDVCGDTRFDRVMQVKNEAKEFPILAAMTAHSPFTLVMGSSWQPDEDIVIPYFNTHPEMKLVIAPHEFDAIRLKHLLHKIKRPVALYSHTSAEAAGKLDCIIIDCFGILSSLYRYGSAAYVGGGFGAGIHNINEAAVYGIPVIFGPNFGKFREASDLIAVGGGFSINNAHDFKAVADSLIGDHGRLHAVGAIADNYIKNHVGATDFIYQDLFPGK